MPTTTFTTIETEIVSGPVSIMITTDYNPTLGYTTEIHNGQLKGKKWVGKSTKSANRNHERAVQMVVKRLIEN